MRITNPSARAGIVTASVLLVPVPVGIVAAVIDASVGGERAAFDVNAVLAAVLLTSVVGAVLLCVRAFRGLREDRNRPRPWWRMTEGPIGSIVGAASFLLLALLWTLGSGFEVTVLRYAGVLVFGGIALAFTLSALRLIRLEGGVLAPPRSGE